MAWSTRNSELIGCASQPPCSSGYQVASCLSGLEPCDCGVNSACQAPQGLRCDSTRVSDRVEEASRLQIGAHHGLRRPCRLTPELVAGAGGSHTVKQRP